MKIAILNARDKGGAFVACNRLFKGLKGLKEASPELFIQKSKAVKPDVNYVANSFFAKIPYFFSSLINKWLSSSYQIKNPQNFSTNLWGNPLINWLNLGNKDVIHLHWINDSFISLKGLQKIGKLNKPVFWTLHDLWPITGGCHYNRDCYKFETFCHQCPELNSTNDHDIAYQIWLQKTSVYQALDPIFIAPSQWMARQIEKSSLGKHYPVHTIPNAIDHQHFQPLDQVKSREYWGLPKDKRLILFGAINATNDDRKGFEELANALSVLEQDINMAASNAEFVVFGNQNEPLADKLSTKIHFLGHLANDEQLINCYNASDFLVVPSKQDNLPNTIMEALACGIPCIGFDTGGIPEMIEHQSNGLVANQGDSQDLAKWLKEAIHLDKESLGSMKDAARQKVLQEYTYEKVAKQHLALYEHYLNPSA